MNKTQHSKKSPNIKSKRKSLKIKHYQKKSSIKSKIINKLLIYKKKIQKKY